MSRLLIHPWPGVLGVCLPRSNVQVQKPTVLSETSIKMSVALAPDASAPASDASAAANPCLVDGGQNFAESFNLRVAAFFIIFVCSALGVVLPLVVRFRACLSGAVRDGWLFIAKAFGAGVILAVGFIHVFPDAFTTMSDPCLGAPGVMHLAPCRIRPMCFSADTAQLS